ncbi:hypothetical protein VTN00DRAFT_5650 [Thermoascus crustaceus]|uniref:uncharacterized protein n=1 Tax=Thermoascus crustaceus TaxID=5088 RepID=UPI0037423BBD
MDDRETSGIGEISDEEEKIDDEETQGEEKGGEVGFAATTVADDVYLWQMKRDLAPAGVGSSRGQSRPATANDGATEPDGPAQRLFALVDILEALYFQKPCWCAVLLCCAVLVLGLLLRGGGPEPSSETVEHNPGLTSFSPSSLSSPPEKGERPGPRASQPSRIRTDVIVSDEISGIQRHLETVNLNQNRLQETLDIQVVAVIIVPPMTFDIRLTQRIDRLKRKKTRCGRKGIVLVLRLRSLGALV